MILIRLETDQCAGENFGIHKDSCPTYADIVRGFPLAEVLVLSELQNIHTGL